MVAQVLRSMLKGDTAYRQKILPALNERAMRREPLSMGALSETHSWTPFSWRSPMCPHEAAKTCKISLRGLQGVPANHLGLATNHPYPLCGKVTETTRLGQRGISAKP